MFPSQYASRTEQESWSTDHGAGFHANEPEITRTNLFSDHRERRDVG